MPNPLNAVRKAARATLALLALAACALAGPAMADPPTRVVRLAIGQGAASVALAGASDWLPASPNRPFAVGDRIWIAADGRAELQTPEAAIRLGGESLLTMLDFDDHALRLQLHQGSLRVLVRAGDQGTDNAIVTPNLSFAMVEPGDYRIDVDPHDGATLVAVRRGRAEVSSDGQVYSVFAGRAYRFNGTGLRAYAEIALPPTDTLDTWAEARERQWTGAASQTYVSPGVLGYEDLDAWGSWQQDPGYGAVWYPRAVPSGWVPYSLGHWAFIAPWGWTWIDDAPWGFAVTHYGRWIQAAGRWGWVPGPRTVRAAYAPALVAFIGGPGFQLTLSSGPAQAIGWYPLAPSEIYRPWYPVSRGYFGRINVTNTIVTRTRVEYVYDHRERFEERHVHRAPSAIVAVPAGAFARTEPVGRTRIPMDAHALEQARRLSAPTALPTPMQPERSAAPQGVRPPMRAFEALAPARAQEAPRVERPIPAERERALDRERPPQAERAIPSPRLSPAEHMPMPERRIAIERPASIERPAVVERPTIQRPPLERPTIERTPPAVRPAPFAHPNTIERDDAFPRTPARRDSNASPREFRAPAEPPRGIGPRFAPPTHPAADIRRQERSAAEPRIPREMRNGGHGRDHRD